MLDDEENPIWTTEDFARAGGPESLSTAELAAFPKTAKRIGRPPADAAKVAVSLRLDPEVLAYFRAGGRGWQTRINAVLRQALAQAR